jgi:hypothetical protein
MWLKVLGKRLKVKLVLENYYLTIDYLVTFKIIIKECWHNKINFLYGLVDFGKYLILEIIFGKLEELKFF